ncbi:MAG: leucine-rich repeat domain-containing protein [Pirellulaceae bacterium]
MPQFSFGLLLVASLAIVLIRPIPGILIHVGVYAAACVFDQTRIQPQVISLIVLMAACAHPEGTWFARWYLVAMWLWSGLHKLLSAEWLGWGSWSFLEACGIDGNDWHLYFALTVAGGEILVALAAIIWPRRAAPCCVVLHLGILLALLVRNHNASVWPWNLATAVVGAWILLRPAVPHMERWRLGIVSGLLVLPAAYYANLLNPHLAFVLYSGNLPLAYHTTPTKVSELGGWHGLAVPFPDSPRLYLQAFRHKAAAGDKLAIDDPRWGQSDRYYVMTVAEGAQEVTRERFLSGGSQEVEGIELPRPSAIWQAGRQGVTLKFDEHRLEISALATGRRFTNRALDDLSSLPNLRQLEIEDAPITDDGLHHLRDLPRLEILRIRRCPITDDGLKKLGGSGRLVGLELKQTLITSTGLEVLARLKGLTVLHLPAADIDNAGLAHIGNLRELNWLDLSETNITGTGLASLASLEKCSWINLSRTPIDDQGLKHLGRMSGLQVIELAGTKISDAGLIHLSPLLQCEHLDLDETKVTDEGLVHLHGLTNLKLLSLRATSVSEAGAAKLQRQLPNCQVVR